MRYVSRAARLAAVMLVLVLRPIAVRAQAAPVRAVLVTGASSGLGRAIAERLAQDGFFVYAGARQAADIAELSAIPNVRGVRLDVTSTAEVDSALALITREGRGLYGVVNNAGIVTGGALIATPDEDLRRMLDVNVMGAVRVTRAAAPLLIASKGRIVTISSLSGIVSQPMLGVYSMTKHATEAFGDALGAEMAPFGVTSSLIEPGNYRSEIGANAMPALQEAAERAKGTPFERAMQNFVRSMGTFATNPPPDSVAAAAAHAFTAPVPRPRYLVVPEEGQQRLTIRRAIEELVQLNAGSSYRYDREQLITLLDQALSRGTPSDAWWPIGRASTTIGVCARDARYRALDFLHGEWRVTGARGGPPQRSVLSAVLDGCATLEDYNGGSGRSLTYRDPVSGQWYQDYIDTQRLTLRLFGEASADSLVMRDSVRVIPGGPRLQSRFTWTRTSGSAGFRQQWWMSADSGRTFAPNFDGRYARGELPSIGAGIADSTCDARLARLGLQHLSGEWRMPTAGGWRVAASRPSRTCTMELRVTGPQGYAGWWLLYEDTYIGTVHAVLLDNAGGVARLRASAHPGQSSVPALEFAGVTMDGGQRRPVQLTLRPMRDRLVWQIRDGTSSSASFEQRWCRPPLAGGSAGASSSTPGSC